MRSYRKRPWAALLINMTPLIDVVFLIIIFFIIMINFSEIHIRNVNLPKADESHSGRVEKIKVPVTIKSEELIFLERKRVHIGQLADVLKRRYANANTIKVQIRADETVSYKVVKSVMLELAQADITQVQFATWQGEPDPLE
ncbi:MAG: biopolymer transporter ExbD [Desulfatitalea sp.]|nr:biopolymer transporter ExbD [Desulfatitalea sp.]